MKRFFEQPFKAAALAVAGAALGLAAPAARADLIDQTTVYIRCQTGDGKPREGSGVMISADGMVLTAKHVVYGDAGTSGDLPLCVGTIGDRKRPKSEMTIKKVSDYDAVLLKYPVTGTSPYLRFCRLTPDLKRKTILATGFPLGTPTGVPSTRAGILSTVEPDIDGLIESDIAAARGISGGMVMLEKSEALIGILTGVQTDKSTGLVKVTTVLAAQVLETEFGNFGLEEHEAACVPMDALSPVLGADWKATDGPLDLGFSTSEAYCFIVSVWGEMNSPDDKVEIADIGGNYVLRGQNGGGAGDFGAHVQCRRF